MTEHQAKDVRKEQILDAACRQFASNGFENSSVDDIAHEAGLSKGAIYWHFKSKLDILFEITDRFVHENQQEIVRLAESDQYGPEALYKSHRVFWEQLQQYPVRDQMFNQLCSLAGQHPEIRGRLAKYHREWDDTVTALLEGGVAKGHFRPMDCRHIAQAINAMYHGVTVQSQMDPEMDPVAIIEAATKLMYDALVIRNGENEPERPR